MCVSCFAWCLHHSQAEALKTPCLDDHVRKRDSALVEFVKHIVGWRKHLRKGATLRLETAAVDVCSTLVTQAQKAMEEGGDPTAMQTLSAIEKCVSMASTELLPHVPTLSQTISELQLSYKESSAHGNLDCAIVQFLSDPSSVTLETLYSAFETCRTSLTSALLEKLRDSTFEAITFKLGCLQSRTVDTSKAWLFIDACHSEPRLLELCGGDHAVQDCATAKQIVTLAENVDTAQAELEGVVGRGDKSGGQSLRALFEAMDSLRKVLQGNAPVVHHKELQPLIKAARSSSAPAFLAQASPVFSAAAEAWASNSVEELKAIVPQLSSLAGGGANGKAWYSSYLPSKHKAKDAFQTWLKATATEFKAQPVEQKMGAAVQASCRSHLGFESHAC